jgi:hypothetical protein
VTLGQGAKTTVSFALPFGSLAFWNAGKQAYATRNGSWTIEVGNSSAAIADSASIMVTGGVSPATGPQVTASAVATGIGIVSYRITFTDAAPWQASIIRPDGKVVWSSSGSGPSTLSFHPPAQGLYLLRLQEKNKTPRLLKFMVDR